MPEHVVHDAPSPCKANSPLAPETKSAEHSDGTWPGAAPPPFNAKAVAAVLCTHPGFTTRLIPDLPEGFFTVNRDEPPFDESWTPADNDRLPLLLTFPHATPTLVRTAVALLRRAGYAATPQDTDRRGYTVRVPSPGDTAAAERACRLLWAAGLPRTNSPRQEVTLPSFSPPVPDPHLPGHVQIDMVIPAAADREMCQESAAALTATLTGAGWSVQDQGSGTFRATPPPTPQNTRAHPAPGTCVLAEPRESIAALVHDNWGDEHADYSQQDPTAEN